MLFREGVGLVAAEHQHAVMLEAGAQRDHQQRFCVLKSGEIAQLRVVQRLSGEDRLRLFERQPQNAALAFDLHLLVAARQVARRHDAELVFRALKQQRRADHPRSLAVVVAQKQLAGVLRGFEHAPVIERRADRIRQLVVAACARAVVRRRIASLKLVQRAAAQDFRRAQNGASTPRIAGKIRVKPVSRAGLGAVRRWWRQRRQRKRGEGDGDPRQRKRNAASRSPACRAGTTARRPHRPTKDLRALSNSTSSPPRTDR